MQYMNKLWGDKYERYYFLGSTIIGICYYQDVCKLV